MTIEYHDTQEARFRPVHKERAHPAIRLAVWTFIVFWWVPVVVLLNGCGVI